MLIRLNEYTTARDSAWGSEEGRRVHDCLMNVVNLHPDAITFNVSLLGIRQTDSAFARESVIALARHFRGQLGFYLSDIVEDDVVYTWDLVAMRQKQPLVLLRDEGRRILGPQPAEGLLSVYNFVVSSNGTTTSQISEALDLNISNASNKLRNLQEQGYILRRDRFAKSGGVEFEYFGIG